MKPARNGIRWPLLLLAVLVVVVLAIFFFQRRPAPQPQEVPAPTVRDRNELQLVDGRWLDHGEPFTGIVVEHYGDGTMKSRSAVSNGLLEGLSEGWHTNGVLQITEHFRGGVSDGLRTKFYPDGKKLSEAQIVNGEIDGLYEKWHENGQLAERVHLKRGVADGESLAFHTDGSLKARVRLENGKVVEQKFWEPGEQRMPKSEILNH